MTNRGARGNTNAMDVVWEEYVSEDDYDEDDYDEDLYGEEANKVVVYRTGSSQYKLSGVEEFFKLDSTVFRRTKEERAWRLKAIARKKHNRSQKIRSRSESSRNHFTLILLKLWAAMLTLGEILVNTAVKPIHHIMVGISVITRGSMRIVSTFRAPSATRTWVCANTISCSRVTSEEADGGNELYGSPDVVMNSLQRKAMTELKAAMHMGLDGDLDNMNITVGSSMAEVQKRGRIRAKVKACPDSGATRSLAGPKFARKFGCRITREKINISNASGNSMQYEGTAFFRIFFEDQAIEVPVLLSQDIEGRMIIGKYDLIRLHVLPPNFPQVLPARMFRNETQ